MSRLHCSRSPVRYHGLAAVRHYHPSVDAGVSLPQRWHSGFRPWPRRSEGSCGAGSTCSVGADLVFEIRLKILDLVEDDTLGRDPMRVQPHKTGVEFDDCYPVIAF